MTRTGKKEESDKPNLVFRMQEILILFQNQIHRLVKRFFEKREKEREQEEEKMKKGNNEKLEKTAETEEVSSIP
jgi:hypothetical protein